MTREDKRAYNYARDRLANDDYPVYSDEYELKLAYKAGIEDAKNRPHWISVEDELPPYGDQVLVYAQESPECGWWWSRRYTEDKTKFMSIDGETEYQVLTDKNGFASMRDESGEPLQVSHWQKIKPPVLSNSENTGKDLKGGEK